MAAKLKRKSKKTKQKAKLTRVLKVRHPIYVPPAETLPELPVRDLVDAIGTGEVAEIKFVNPEPSRWKRIKDWLAG